MARKRTALSASLRARIEDGSRRGLSAEAIAAECGGVPGASRASIGRYLRDLRGPQRFTTRSPALESAPRPRATAVRVPRLPTGMPAWTAAELLTAEAWDGIVPRILKEWIEAQDDVDTAAALVLLDLEASHKRGVSRVRDGGE